jgi:hypothetical protein
MSFEANKLLDNLLRQGHSCIINKLWFNKPKKIKSNGVMLLNKNA